MGRWAPSLRHLQGRAPVEIARAGKCGVGWHAGGDYMGEGDSKRPPRVTGRVAGLARGCPSSAADAKGALLQYCLAVGVGVAQAESTVRIFHAHSSSVQHTCIFHVRGTSKRV